MRVQELPGGQPNSHKTLDVYSALRDPLTGDVRLFLEYYLKHPLHMTPKEREGPYPTFSDVFAGCIFSDSRDFSATVEVPAKEVCAASPCMLPLFSQRRDMRILHFGYK